MAIGIDTSKWKPRKIKGTPAAKVRNYLACGTIAFGLIIGVFFSYTPLTIGVRKASERLLDDPIEEVERKRMIASGLPNRSTESLRKLIEESQRVDTPDK